LGGFFFINGWDLKLSLHLFKWLEYQSSLLMTVLVFGLRGWLGIDSVDYSVGEERFP